MICNYKGVLNLLLKGTFILREKLAQTELFAASALAKKAPLRTENIYVIFLFYSESKKTLPKSPGPAH